MGFAMSDERAQNGEAAPKVYTKQELESFVTEISKQVVGSTTAFMHSMLALNHILRQPNAAELLDDELREQLKDLWIKLKSMGLQLNDPPILFGIPESLRQTGERAPAPALEGDGKVN